jgi:hypothetical protein
MSTPIEQAEETVKKQAEEMISRCFHKHKTAVAEKNLTINKIEEIMLEAQADAERILRNAIPAMLKASEEELIKKKIIAPIAVKH